MRGRPGLGALVGLGVGAVLMLLMFLPRIVSGDTYEIADPVAFFAVPFVVLTTGVGALVGVRPRRPDGAPAADGVPGAGDEARADGTTGAHGDGRSAVRAGAVTGADRRPALLLAAAAVVLALWTILWAMGFVAVPPLGIG